VNGPVPDQRGQASIELLAGAPALFLAGLVALQLFAVGYSLTVADGAAESGALAVAAGKSARPAVRAALPDWADGRVAIEREDGRVSVELRPPSPLRTLSERLAVHSSVWVRQPEDAP
jgi:hypothetical protein